MNYFLSPNSISPLKQRQAKAAATAESLPKDAISLSDGKPAEAFLASAVNLLRDQQPVWIPSSEDLMEMQKQQTMLAMMAAIKQGEKGEEPPSPFAAANADQAALLHQVDLLAQRAQGPVQITYTADDEFVNLDSEGITDGDHRVTLGNASRAIFAKSANAAKKFNLPVACFVASIKNHQLGIVFHAASNGSRSINIELGALSQCRLTDAHLVLLTNQFGMVEQQARVFAGTIALQAIGYDESITAALVQNIADQYRIDYEGMLRLAISIEKWRVAASGLYSFEPRLAGR